MDGAPTGSGIFSVGPAAEPGDRPLTSQVPNRVVGLLGKEPEGLSLLVTRFAPDSLTVQNEARVIVIS